MKRFQPDPPRSLRYYDSTIQVRFNGEGNPRPLWHQCLNELRSMGFAVGGDPHTNKHYPILAGNHRLGEHPSGLKFETNINGTSRWDARNRGGNFEITFFQDIAKENPHGGRYDFNKRERMPFLLRMRYHHARRRLDRIFKSHNLTDITEPDLSRMPALERVQHSNNTCIHTEGADMWQRTPESPSNGRDGDGLQIIPGSIRYFYSRDRRLRRGKVFYDLNMMWHVVTGPREIQKIAASQLFAWREDLPRRIAYDAKPYLQRAMKQAANSFNFERAIRLRDHFLRLGGDLSKAS